MENRGLNLSLFNLRLLLATLLHLTILDRWYSQLGLQEKTQESLGQVMTVKWQLKRVLPSFSNGTDASTGQAAQWQGLRSRLWWAQTRGLCSHAQYDCLYPYPWMVRNICGSRKWYAQDRSDSGLWLGRTLSPYSRFSSGSGHCSTRWTLRECKLCQWASASSDCWSHSLSRLSSPQWFDSRSSPETSAPRYDYLSR